MSSYSSKGAVHYIDPLDLDIEELEFSTKTYNVLKEAGIGTLRDLFNKNSLEPGKTIHIGKRSLDELYAKLSELGVPLAKMSEEAEIDEDGSFIEPSIFQIGRTLPEILHAIISFNGIKALERDRVLMDVLKKNLEDKKQLNIISALIQTGSISKVVEASLSDKTEDRIICTSEICDVMHNEWTMDPEAVHEVLLAFEEAIRTGKTEREKLFGKSICKSLKEMRIKFAEANGIEYSEEICTNDNPCKGTCPYCEERNQYLLEQAQKLSAQQEIIYPHVDMPDIENPSDDSGTQDEESGMDTFSGTGSCSPFPDETE
jgi:hypothetical protein